MQEAHFSFTWQMKSLSSLCMECIQWTSSQNFMWLFGFLIYVFWICLSFIPAFFCNQSCGGLLESVPAVLRQMQGDTLSDHRPFTLTSWQFSLLLICIFLDCGRKLKNLLENSREQHNSTQKGPLLWDCTCNTWSKFEWLTSLADMSRHSQWQRSCSSIYDFKMSCREETVFCWFSGVCPSF